MHASDPVGTLRNLLTLSSRPLGRMLDTEQSNPELFTKAQLEKCQDESASAAGKAETLGLLKAALESGMVEL